ncbi:hypothetical protein ACFFNX_47530, partial [Actinoallomurus acaciae]
MTILALDQGTFATKALVVRPDGTVAGAAGRPVRSAFPVPGAVEIAPGELFASVLDAGRAALAEVRGRGRVSAVVLERDGHRWSVPVVFTGDRIPDHERAQGADLGAVTRGPAVDATSVPGLRPLTSAVSTGRHTGGDRPPA